MRTKFSDKKIKKKSQNYSFRFKKFLNDSIKPTQSSINITIPPSSRVKSKYDFTSKYDHSWCEKVLKYGAQGMSTNTIALKLGVSQNCMFMWARKVPEFKEALDTAQQLSKGWWEEVGRLNLQNRSFNNTLYIMNMQNRFGWHRYIDPSAPVVFNSQVQNNLHSDNKINIDYSKLSNDELKNIDQLISRAIIDDKE